MQKILDVIIFGIEYGISCIR